MKPLFLILAAAAPIFAQNAAGFRRADIEEVAGLLLKHAGYSATTLVYVPPRTERGVLAEARPARGEPSAPIYVEERGLNQVCRTRGQLAFLLGHELAHLVHKDAERTDAFSAWARAEGLGGDRLRQAEENFDRFMELQADAASLKWLGETADPRTGTPFPTASAEEALRNVLAWRATKGLPDFAPPKLSLEERIRRIKESRTD
jgi:hypothetical protein